MVRDVAPPFAAQRKAASRQGEPGRELVSQVRRAARHARGWGKVFDSIDDVVGLAGERQLIGDVPGRVGVENVEPAPG